MLSLLFVLVANSPLAAVPSRKPSLWPSAEPRSWLWGARHHSSEPPVPSTGFLVILSCELQDGACRLHGDTPRRVSVRSCRGASEASAGTSKPRSALAPWSGTPPEAVGEVSSESHPPLSLLTYAKKVVLLGPASSGREWSKEWVAFNRTSQETDQLAAATGRIPQAPSPAPSGSRQQ